MFETYTVCVSYHNDDSENLRPNQTPDTDSHVRNVRDYATALSVVARFMYETTNNGMGWGEWGHLPVDPEGEDLVALSMTAYNISGQATCNITIYRVPTSTDIEFCYQALLTSTKISTL